MSERLTILDSEEYLRQISKEVDFNDKSYLKDVAKLETFCLATECFALAAILSLLGGYSSHA